MWHYHSGLPCFSVQSAPKPVYFVTLLIPRVNSQSVILHNDFISFLVSLQSPGYLIFMQVIKKEKQNNMLDAGLYLKSALLSFPPLSFVFILCQVRFIQKCHKMHKTIAKHFRLLLEIETPEKSFLIPDFGGGRKVEVGKPWPSKLFILLINQQTSFFRNMVC